MILVYDAPPPPPSTPTVTAVFTNVRPAADRAPFVLAESQMYIWTKRWKAGEAAADQDRADGTIERFESADDAIDWLLSTP